MSETKFKDLEDGEIGLVMIQGDRVAQLAVTPEQSAMLKLLLAKVSESNSFVLLGEEYDLVRKSQVKTFKN
jgi:hypothetical protein